MSEPVVETGTPGAKRLVNLVRMGQIKALLLERAPKALNEDGRQGEIMEIIRGIASEVAPIVGDPPPQEMAERAAWCVALGTAAKIESSLFPSQQGGATQSRAETLQVAYLAVKAELGGGSSSSSGSTAQPLFSFPPPPAWPDRNRW